MEGIDIPFGFRMGYILYKVKMNLNIDYIGDE